VNHAAGHAGFELDDLARQDAHPRAVIASPSLDEVNELYEIRITPEPLASARDMAGLIDKTRGPALGRRLRLPHGAAAGSGGATTLRACPSAGGRTVCKTSCNTVAGSRTVPVERQAT
jgi:hypothetical protein